MRWKQKTKIKPHPGARRNKTKFLFFPLNIDSETRWLEFATYTQSLQWTSNCPSGLTLVWENICWADDKQCLSRTQRIKNKIEETYNNRKGNE
jgi:hypothetical protein